ncbi:MAG: hypothetical protein K2X55_13065 [Burkholderiaceae bacterium]|nr:hypothetical protein [Burkholderiaceae bacterium]
MTNIAKTIVSLAVFAALGACQKKPTDVAEAKSYQYYLEHGEETKTVAAKCSEFEQNELSMQPPSKQAAWRETAAGINCSNAQGAKPYVMLAELQKKRAEAAAKYK